MIEDKVSYCTHVTNVVYMRLKDTNYGCQCENCHLQNNLLTAFICWTNSHLNTAAV